MCAEHDSENQAGTPLSQTGRERRAAQRILINLEVDYACEDTFLFAYITDISALGIFIRTTSPEQPGTHLNMRFTLPGDEEALEVEGEVIWINSFRPGDYNNLNPGMGVQFIDLERQQKRRIRLLVRTIAYLEDQPGDDAPDEQLGDDVKNQVAD